MSDDRAMEIARTAYESGVDPFEVAIASIAVYAGSVPAFEREGKIDEMRHWINLFFKPVAAELAN